MSEHAGLTSFIALVIAAFIAGIFFAGAWLLNPEPTFDPVEVWCDGAYDYTFRVDTTTESETRFMEGCMEDMADGRSEQAPTFDIPGFEVES